jgi:hypothetical protein
MVFVVRCWLFLVRGLLKSFRESIAVKIMSSREEAVVKNC